MILFLRILFYAFSNYVNKFCEVASSTLFARRDGVLNEIINYIISHKNTKDSFRYVIYEAESISNQPNLFPVDPPLLFRCNSPLV